MAANTPDVAGPFGGAEETPLLLHEDNLNPYYTGGKRGGMAGYFGKQAGARTYRPIRNPYMDQWSKDAEGNQLQDRQQLADLYAQLQKQAAGGMTPQQQQMLGGMGKAAQVQNNMVATAPGGARARAAGMGALTQQSGIQGAQNAQTYAMQKAQDQISAQNQMVQVATAQRAADLQAQGMTAEDAQRMAEMDTRARGMNIQRELGYAGLESQAIQNDWNAFLSAYRRQQQMRQADLANKQKNTALAMQTGSDAVAGVMGFM